MLVISELFGYELSMLYEDHTSLLDLATLLVITCHILATRSLLSNIAVKYMFTIYF